MFKTSVLLGTIFTVVSLEAIAGQALTWETCVQQTLQGNSELRAVQRSLQASVYEERGAYSGFFPQISAGLDYNYGTNFGAANSSGASPFGVGRNNADDSYSASINATQNLFSGFQDKAKVDQAKANREESQSNLDRIRAKVSHDLKSAFAGLVFAQSSIDLSQEIIKRREDNLRLVELRFEGGRENKGSLLLSKAYLYEAQYDFLQSKNALAVFQTDLARVLGQDNLEPIQVTGKVPTTPAPPSVDLLQQVMETPDYRQALAQERSAEAAKWLARSAFFPALNLTASAANSGSDWFEDNNSWAVGAGINWLLFSGGKDYYTTKSAIESLKAAALTKTNILQDGLTKLQQAYLKDVEAEQKLEVDRAFEQAAHAREMIAKEKYNNGLLSFEDWDIIENDLIARQRAFLQSERDRVVAEAAWEQALGKGVLMEGVRP